MLDTLIKIGTIIKNKYSETRKYFQLVLTNSPCQLILSLVR